MTTFFLTFCVMLILIGGMAVGVLFGRNPIKGSCGGLGSLGIDAECEICGGNPARCDSNPDSAAKIATADARQLADRANLLADKVAD